MDYSNTGFTFETWMYKTVVKEFRGSNWIAPSEINFVGRKKLSLQADTSKFSHQ